METQKVNKSNIKTRIYLFTFLYFLKKLSMIEKVKHFQEFLKRIEYLDIVYIEYIDNYKILPSRSVLWLNCNTQNSRSYLNSNLFDGIT